MLYRFNTGVDKTHVNDCMLKLTQWSRRHPKCDIEIVFSSGGGSIIDGFVLFDFIQELRSKGHKVTTGSLGMAASMAAILFPVLLVPPDRFEAFRVSPTAKPVVVDNVT